MKFGNSWRPGIIFFLCALFALGAESSDVILKAMRDELQHSRSLDSVKLDKPYFISYGIEDGDLFAASATMGGVIASTSTLFRVPHIEVRVGDYEFDNTNYVGSGTNFGGHYDIDRFPLENRYPVLRRYIWLATDQAYKSAVEALAHKQAALKNMSPREPIPDFARAEPIRLIEEIPAEKLDREDWLKRLRRLSAAFTQYPQVLTSNVELQAIQNVRYLVTSEGTQIRTAEDLLFVRVRASGQAADGMRLRDAVSIHSLQFGGMPNEAQLTRDVRQVAENITALTNAPVGETYNGPVLFEGEAAGQLFAELLAKNLVLTRKPVSEPGRPSMSSASEFEGRQEARILPEWMDVVDDPTQKDFHGRQLFGSFRVDYEGLIPKPLTMVEKGVLKNFLLTRQPVAGFPVSNGRARMPGAFGASTAAASNLFIRVGESVPVANLKKQLLEICKARNQTYGVIVRKLDFPSSASFDEIRRFMAASNGDGRGSHPFSLPILIYKVTLDGKEELMRGVRFRELNGRSLRDIRAAGNDSVVFDYLDNGAPLALMGASSYAAESSIVAPSVLLDDIEIRKLDDELPKLPIVPSPLAAAQ